MTICIRYVDVTNMVIREDLLKWFQTTKAVIKNTIQQKLISIDLRTEYV